MPFWKLVLPRPYIAPRLNAWKRAVASGLFVLIAFFALVSPAAWAGAFPANVDVHNITPRSGIKIAGNTVFADPRSISIAGDVNGDGIDDIVLGLPVQAQNLHTFGPRAAVYVIFGRSTGFDFPIDLGALDGSNGFKLVTSAAPFPTKDTNFGASLDSSGDFNNDGINDIVIGAAQVFPRGRAYIVLGSRNGFAPVIDVENPGASISLNHGGTSSSIAALGATVAFIGDVNGDGIDDMALGAPSSPVNGIRGVGSTLVVFGRASAPVSIDLSTLNGTDGFRVNGVQQDGGVGKRVDGGVDVNGDGLSDILISASNSTGFGGGPGEAYVIFGSNTGFPQALPVSSLDGNNGFTIQGPNNVINLGDNIALLNDINGDGIGEFAVGYDIFNTIGATLHIGFGKTSGFAPIVNIGAPDGTDGFSILGSPSDNNFGEGIGRASDVNGDGLPDIVFGGENTSYVFYGRSGGSAFPAQFNVSSLNGSNGFALLFSPNPVFFGPGEASPRLSGRGDVNGDGIDDIASGGSLRVLFGQNSSPALPNAPPIAQTDALTVSEDGILTGNVYADNGNGADTDPDGDAFFIIAVDGNFDRPGQTVLVAGPDNIRGPTGRPTITLNSDGSLHFDPGLGFQSLGDGQTNVINVTYTIGDGILVNTPSTTTLAITVQGSNDLPTGEATIHGIFTEGAILRVDPTGIVDAEGVGAFSYQWNRNSIAIPGASAVTYTINANDVGAAISVTVSYTDGGGRLEGVTSSPTPAIASKGAGSALPFVTDLNMVDGGNGFMLFSTTQNRASGNTVASTGDVNGDGIDDIIIGPGNGLGGNLFDVGEAYVVFGSKDGFPDATDLSSLDGDNGFILFVPGVEMLGTTQANRAGDINGDGIADMVISTKPGAFGGEGAIYVIFGRPGGFPDKIDLTVLNGTDGFKIQVTENISNLNGMHIGYAGDRNGDGIDDLVISSEFFNRKKGAAFIIFGRRSPFPSTLTVTISNGVMHEPGDSFTHDNIGGHLGIDAAAIGDVNNDGIIDLAIGAPRAGTYNDRIRAGRAYIIYSNPAFSASGGVLLPDILAGRADRGFMFEGGRSNEAAGNRVAGAGDFNADGFDDIIVATQDLFFNPKPPGLAGARSRVYIIYGGANIPEKLSGVDGSNGFSINFNTGSSPAVSNAGDFNNDGFDDIAINDGSKVQVIFGSNAPVTPNFDGGDITASTGLQFTAPGAGDLGGSIHYDTISSGDFNGDGISDLLIGAPGSDFGNNLSAGKAYVAFGASSSSNKAPIANNDALLGSEDDVLIANVLDDNGNGADSDPENDPIFVLLINDQRGSVATQIATAAGATVTVQADGFLLYNPDAVFQSLGPSASAIDRFEYRISDGKGRTASAEVILEIIGQNDLPTGNAMIVGVPVEGDTLSVDTSAIEDLEGLGPFSYQWRRGGTNILGETNATFTLTVSDVGQILDVMISYTDGGGTEESVTSDPTDFITRLGNTPPTGSVLITGTAIQGETLSADTSAVADIDGLGPFSFQWRRDGTDIAGATNTTYVLTQADVGNTIDVRIRYTDGGGTVESVISDPTGTVQGLPQFTLTTSTTGPGSGVLTSAPAGIDCGADCEETYDTGTSVTLSHAATGDSTFTAWSGACSGNGACVLTMDQAHNVSARFELTTPDPTTLFSSVLPSARSGSTGAAPDAPGRSGPQALGDPITVFASVVNAGASAAQSCTIKVPANAPVSLSYQLTDAANAPVGPADASFDVAPAQARSFILSLMPLATNTGVAVFPDFVCDNANVDAIPGVNTVFLSIDNKEVPDILSIGATASGDGIIAVPSGSVGLMTASAINIGVGDAAGSADTAVTVSVDNGAASLPLLLQLCELDAGSLCITPLGEDPVSTIIGDNASFFAVFVTDQSGGAGIALDPANARVFLRFTDAGGTTRSVTSAAISIPVAASADAPQRAASLPEGRWAVMVRKTTGIRHAQTPGVLYVWPDGRARLQSGGQTTALSLAPANDNADAGTFTGLEAKGVIAGQFVPNRALFLVNQRQNTRLDIWGVHDTRGLDGDHD
jgi:Bacterial Ig domain/FG-GAP repeat/Bacterial cadherin-like domain